MRKDIVEVPPITEESFLALVRTQLGREFTPKEEKGFERLLRDSSPTDAQGHFLVVISRAKKMGLPMDDYLKKIRRSNYGIIGSLISKSDEELNSVNNRVRNEEERRWRKIEDNDPDWQQLY